MNTARELRRFAIITGAFCIVLGVLQLIVGVTGTDLASSAVDDSNERFGAGLLIGLGISWIFAARQSALPIRLLQSLSAALLLGGLARVLAIVFSGWPHWWQTTQAITEILVPVAVLTLTAAASKASAP